MASRLSALRGRPDVRVASADRTIECGFRAGELRDALDIPLRGPGHPTYRSMDELREELTAIREFVETDPVLAEYDLSEEDLAELVARLHQILTGQSNDRLNPQQCCTYGTHQRRFSVEKVR